ncbi:helix-turn-helix domain-containing protein [Segatella paludivivens]|uniref:helix-turn-helix domain-containing protein n=1 Tax=Segatella paludivivens TaxID=185294 RepID=UPI00037164FB|nr:helix-turn-helix domain-containing protein [Segatella paludivivens]
MNKVTFGRVQQEDGLYYNNDGIILIDNITQTSLADYEDINLEFNVFVYCEEGKLQLTLNDNVYLLKSQDYILCQAGQHVKDYMMSQDVEFKMLVFTTAAISNSLFLKDAIWNISGLLEKSPKQHLSDEEGEIIEHYYELAKIHMSEDGDQKYNHDIIKLLFQALVMEFFKMADAKIKEEGLPDVTADKSQNGVLFRRFVELLTANDGKIRTVQKAGEMLNVSPKYLSKVISKAGGKTAMQYIHDYTMEAIIYRLKYTDLSIKEIVIDMDFPNISFFGRFVKSMLGMSPREYREKLRKKKL